MKKDHLFIGFLMIISYFIGIFYWISKFNLQNLLLWLFLYPVFMMPIVSFIRIYIDKESASSVIKDIGSSILSRIIELLILLIPYIIPSAIILGIIYYFIK